MGYPTFKVILRVGYGMGYAKWDMQEEVSQAGQIGFGEVKWERPAWPSGSSRCLYRIGLQAISAPVPRPLSLPLPAPPALCPCFCLLPLNHQQSSTHPCVTHVRPLDERLYAGHPHYTPWTRSTVKPASNCHTRPCHKLYLVQNKASCKLWSSSKHRIAGGAIRVPCASKA